jgi:hypothetical protein
MAAAARAFDGAPITRLLERLEGARQTGPNRWIARCPAHGDKHPSLSIREVDDGRVLLHCWAACGTDQVLTAIGMAMADLFPPRQPEHHRRPIPKRSRWDGNDAWTCVAHECAVAAVVAADAAAGRPVSPEDAERAWLASDRLVDALTTLEILP